MSQAQLLRDVIVLLEAAGIPYMVVGSYASAFHGEPRMTRDIDVVVDPTERSLERLADLVDRDRFYMGDPEDALRHRSMFNLIEPSSGWKVDFIIRRDRPFSEVEFGRRFPVQIADVEVYLASAEDTVLAKLEWAETSASDQQMRDVIAIAANRDLDRQYLSRWAAELGVEAALSEALTAADDRRG